MSRFNQRASDAQKSPDEWDLRLRGYYQDSVLSDGVVQKIITDVPRRSLQFSGRNVWRVTLAASAGIVVCLAATFGYFALDRERLYENVATEIAWNHSKQMPAEFVGNDLTEIAGSFDRLEFPLHQAANELPAHSQLLGARYCTVQGQLAAQLQLLDAAGIVQTLYVAPAHSELAKITGSRASRFVELPAINPSGQKSASTVQVRIWRSGDLIYGLAQTQSTLQIP